MKIKEIHSFSVKKNLDLPSLAALEKKITLSILPVRSRLLGKLSKKNVEVQSTGECYTISVLSCPINLSCPGWLAVSLSVCLSVCLPFCTAGRLSTCITRCTHHPIPHYHPFRSGIGFIARMSQRVSSIYGRVPVIVIVIIITSLPVPIPKHWCLQHT